MVSVDSRLWKEPRIHRRYEVTDYEWAVLEPLLSGKPRGAPNVDDQRVINEILCRFRTDSLWTDIPAPPMART